jgi:uncharacterized protein (TIGR00251 family)
VSEKSGRALGDARHPEGAIFNVRITPRSSRSSLELGSNGVLHARVDAPPVDGAANKALLKLIARTLRIAPSRVVLTGGHQSRHKRIRIEGLDNESVRELLMEANPAKERSV